MAEPAKSIIGEQLRRGMGATGNFPWRILSFTIVIFATLLFIYLGMAFGYKPYLDSQLKSLDKKIADSNKGMESGEPKTLITLYSQLVNIQNLLSSHPLPSKVLQFLQTNTDQSVYYQSLTTSLSDRTAKLDGIASDYNALVRQLEFFRRSPEIKSVFLDDSRQRDQGGVQFAIRLIFSPNIFKSEAAPAESNQPPQQQPQQ